MTGFFSRPLTDFMATLHKNGMEEKKLSKYVTHRISDDHDVVTLSVSFPEEGQYGMDIYTRELRDGRTRICWRLARLLRAFTFRGRERGQSY